MFKKLLPRSKGFTLIEILIVIGIIAILAAIVIIAINPAKQFAQARNSQRTSNVNAILNAIGQRIADNRGTFPGPFTIGGVTYTCPTLPAAATTVDSAGGGAGINLDCLVPTYMPILTVDPSNPTVPSTGYTVEVDTAGRVKVCAPAAALETSVPTSGPLCVTR